MFMRQMSRWRRRGQWVKKKMYSGGGGGGEKRMRREDEGGSWLPMLKINHIQGKCVSFSFLTFKAVTGNNQNQCIENNRKRIPRLLLLPSSQQS